MSTHTQLLAILATDKVSETTPVLTDGPRIYLPDGRDTRSVTPEWIRSNVSMDQAVNAWNQPDRGIEHDTRAPWKGTVPTPGTWRFDPVTAEWEVFLHLDPSVINEMYTRESIRRMDSYRVYRAWAEAGHIPPPCTVLRQAERGILFTSDYRRLLIALDLGRPLGAWFSETNVNGGPYWRLPTGTRFWETVERVQTRERYRPLINARRGLIYPMAA